MPACFRIFGRPFSERFWIILTSTTNFVNYLLKGTGADLTIKQVCLFAIKRAYILTHPSTIEKLKLNER